MSGKINKSVAKTTQLDELQEQKDYQIGLLNKQVEQLQMRLTESNNASIEKDKQLKLLQDELNDTRKKLTECANKKNSTNKFIYFLLLWKFLIIFS